MHILISYAICEILKTYPNYHALSSTNALVQIFDLRWKLT